MQMRQVILNLLLNAMDAAGDGGRVRVDVKQADSDNEPTQAGSVREVEIQVADNGPGVPDEMKERIFEPFVSSKKLGMGLGLAVSQRIVEAHGGQITVTDDPGVGARFTVKLPTGGNDE
jgi:signal transduction histidine kinase